jgi:hypothetical protein
MKRREMRMPPSLPEIPERDAPADVAAIYHDMRRTMRLPLVNLVYRHLATLPGLLPWVWGALRPAILSGVLDAAVERVTASAEIVPLAPIEAATLEEAGLSAAEIAAIVRVVAAYNRGNSLNLVALSAVRQALDEPLAGAPGRAGPEPPQFSQPALPPIRRLDDLDEQLAARIAEIAALHGGGEAGVIPSLYLHLANWPPFLALVADRVLPSLQDGTVGRVRDDLILLARTEAQQLAPALSTSTPVPSEHEDHLRRVLSTFAAGVIPEMACVGLALGRAMRPA